MNEEPLPCIGVHGLERESQDRIDFAYLHVGKPRTSIVRERIGVVAASTLTTGLEELLKCWREDHYLIADLSACSIASVDGTPPG